ncbi:MAG: hypothetical protein ABJA50_03530 [Chloroflexota bacterium]
MELSCRRFALFGGAQVDADSYSVCVHPGAPGLQKRGTLALITEASGSLAQGEDACRLVQRAVVDGYFSDHSLGLTGSLLNALDTANNAVLQHNSGWADKEGNQSATAVAQIVKTRKTRVGMTAMLIRPDGTGLYLAQMAPTQVYLLHNDVLTALPEPPSWKQQEERPVVTLKRIMGAEDGEEAAVADEDALDLPITISDVPEPALALGTAPGLQADLIYRRISEGDKVILVSSDLARYIERDWAEQTFAWKDADGISDALYALAMERTLAEAHACVLELGVPASSGVDVDYTTPVATRPAEQVDHDGGSAVPQGPQPQKQAGNLIEALRGPREWLSRRRGEGQPLNAGEVPQVPNQYEATGEPQPQMATGSEEQVEQEEDGDNDAIWSRQPTQLFVQRTPELPPYQRHATAEALPSNYEEEEADELQFDGWEDMPPALDNPRFNASHNVIYKPRLLEDAAARNEYADGFGTFPEATPSRQHPDMHIVEEEFTRTPAKSAAAERAQIALGWASKTLRAMLPDKLAGAGGGKMKLPLRLVILGVLGVVGIVLILSLVNIKGNPQRTAAHNLLTEAQALETSANQSGVAETARLEQLQLALDKAQQATQDDPQSKDASTLITKLNGELDSARGITRLSSLKVLFDLDAIDNAAKTVTTTTGVGAATNPAPTTAPAAGNMEIVGQGNDLYALDRSTNSVYRCQIASKSCSPLLNKGDNVGGTKVSDLVAVTLRVGSPVVVDSKLVSYVYNADSGSWNAQQLGSADTLQQPIGIATYDGNLYLLGAKPGQISKYASGQYGQSPIDWITDDTTKAAMQSPVAIAIDGAIYVTLADGKILVMQGGKLTTTITPKASTGTSVPTELYTGTDLQNIYLLRSEDGSITRINKEGKTLAILKAPADAEVTSFSGMAVDEGKSKVYLAQGRKVYEAPMGSAEGVPAQTTTQQSVSQTPQPTVRPTVEP